LKLLLDTHIWLWSLGEPEKLSERVLRELSSSENELWLSPISMWEALVLYAKRRIQVRGEIQQLLAEAAANFREAPLTHEIVLATHLLPFPHRDPADRFLAATAEVLGLTLVTADQRLLGLGKIATLRNQ
jgi:PIN domain nuclease of toxin-antitoxin system